MMSGKWNFSFVTAFIIRFRNYISVLHIKPNEQNDNRPPLRTSKNVNVYATNCSFWAFLICKLSRQIWMWNMEKVVEFGLNIQFDLSLDSIKFYTVMNRHESLNWNFFIYL